MIIFAEKIIMAASLAIVWLGGRDIVEILPMGVYKRYQQGKENKPI